MQQNGTPFGVPFSFIDKVQRKPRLQIVGEMSVSRQYQQLPFSEQNSTFFPSRIIFVVRTAHILPHIEQV